MLVIPILYFSLYNKLDNEVGYFYYKFYKEIMKYNETITKSSDNRATESRRINRVKSLVVAGFSMEKIKIEMNLSPFMLNFYSEKALHRVEYQKYSVNHDPKYIKSDGVAWGNKTQQYYPPEYCSEMKAWKMPEYKWEDLSDDEKNLIK